MTKKPPKGPKGPKKPKGGKVVQFPGGKPVPLQQGEDEAGKYLAPINPSNPVGRPPHEPTQVSRNLVTLGCATGLTQEQIARRLGIAEETLRQHYGEELADAGQKLLLSISGNLARIAQDPNHPKCVTAAIFWLKTRGGFRDVSLPGDGGGGGRNEKVSFTINIGGSGPRPGDGAKLVNG